MENIFTLVSIIKYLYLQHPIIRKITLIILFYSLVYVFHTFYKKPFQIEDLKLKIDKFSLMFVIIFIISLNVVILLYRLKNIGKYIDLLELLTNIEVFLCVTTYINIILSIIMGLGIFLFFIYLLLLLRKFTFLIFCKLNFFIIYKYGISKNREENFYNKFKWDFFIYYFSQFRYFPLRFIEKIFGELSYKKSQIILMFFPYYGIILLLLSFFYDIFFNDAWLFFYFYLLPLALLYQILYSIYSSFGITYDTEEVIICNYLYDENISYIDNTFISSTGNTFTMDQLNEINFFIEKNFDRTKFFYEYQKLYKKKPSIS